MSSFRRLSVLAITAAAATVITATGPAQADSQALRGRGAVDVRLIGINDLHGNLEPPTGSSGRVVLADGTTVDAGGAAYNATHIKNLRNEVKNSVVVGQGDLIGASPLTSALFHDEPTIEVLNNVGMETTAAGNHEFDEGYQELLRMQRGGCHPKDGCQFRDSYPGAKFPILGANVTKTKTGLPALPPFWVEIRDGMPIGFIGMPLKDVPILVDPNGIKEIQFGDEVKAANKYANFLDAIGVKAIVLLVHQGDQVTSPGGGPNACNVAAQNPGSYIATNVSPKIDAVFSGHSHQHYNCVVKDPAGNPRPFIEGLAFGRELSVVDLKIDRRTRDVIRSETKADNKIVTRTVAPDPDVQAVIDLAKQKSAPLANKPVGVISTNIPRQAVPSGESPLGNLIADSQLAATKDGTNGAVLALMNPGGVRADLTYASSPAGEGDGVVTYGEAFTVQPFGNTLATVTLTGAQLKNVLEQQFTAARTFVLQPSAGLKYTWSLSAPFGSKVSGITLNGVPLDPAASYRVTINSFLQGGGDGFSEFTKGTNVVGGGIDLDAFTAYLDANKGVGAPATDRITQVS
ncbi:bifunctional metallophosphatase/5'-nucleotidase [Lentzea flava]|uniref:Bifunctional metallophosphatase/5'-nucleotidase n=1 Tax=Lentzea flava TaxID=103732 RepID=A0ABQ2UEN1_9PSEU|nr:bifunctional metallophosphatase/5'-nucleotidase [Lentzea flava]MCP2197776.1 5'-nucleotidase [Lentzea flava]GGU22098.1 bifunctional metallophosphatase/5'-nucleotidase [Lentzea flava]